LRHAGDIDRAVSADVYIEARHLVARIAYLSRSKRALSEQRFTNGVSVGVRCA